MQPVFVARSALLSAASPWRRRERRRRLNGNAVLIDEAKTPKSGADAAGASLMQIGHCVDGIAGQKTLVNLPILFGVPCLPVARVEFNVCHCSKYPV